MVDAITPEHYKIGGIETWDYLKAKLSPTQLAGYALGNVIKYISRAEHKNKVEDLQKAKWYLDKIIDELSVTKEPTPFHKVNPMFKEWKGGSLPDKHLNDLAQVVLRNGTITSVNVAGKFDWKHYDEGTDIVAYRLII